MNQDVLVGGSSQFYGGNPFGPKRIDAMGRQAPHSMMMPDDKYIPGRVSQNLSSLDDHCQGALPQKLVSKYNNA